MLAKHILPQMIGELSGRLSRCTLWVPNLATIIADAIGRATDSIFAERP
jgi:hypothetical protein